MGARRRRRRPDRGATEKTSVAGGRVLARTPWLCLLLVAVNLAVYAPVWRHDFTGYDDPDYITRNPRVAAGLTWDGLAWAFTTSHVANWHPLTWLSHMLDVELFGLNPGPHHLMSLLLHIISTLLLFGVLRRTTGQAGRSAVVAALFGVHPLHVESVAWAAERKDVLSALFWMLTLWAYVGYVRRPGLGRYLGVVGLFAAGLLAKPMLVTLPFVLLLLDVWPLGRLSAPAASADRPGPSALIDPRAALRLALEKLPLLVLTLASSVTTFVVQRSWGAVGGLDAFPFERRAASAVVTYVAYIGKMFWPTRLAVLYPYPRSLPSWWVIGSVVILLGVSVVALRLARRAPYLPVGWFWYVGTLVPVIGLVQVGSQSMAADRYTYVPLIGLFIVLAWGIPDLLGRRYPRSALPVAAALAIVACAILAGRQVRYWANTEVLWTRAVEVTSANYQAHNDLGNILAAQGRVEAAAAHFAEALRLRPDFVEAHNNLGFTLARLGRTDEAMAHFAEALRLRPTYAEAHNNLGLALAAHGRADEAIREFREALRLKPDAAETHVNVAVLLARQGQADEAVRHYAEAIRLEPAAPDAHYLLGQLLADQGNVEDAARHLETALRLNPRLLKARQALGELAARRAGTAPRPR